MRNSSDNYRKILITKSAVPLAVIFSLFLILLLSFFNSPAYSQTYYFANNGDDSYTDEQAQNPETPWKTLDKLNSLSLKPGATVLFKKGDIWRGQIKISKSGTKGNPITFGSYGNGDKPVISGSVIVSGWSIYKDNIYKATVSERVVQLFLNDKRQMLARYPNSGYLIIDKVNNSKSFSDNDIDASVDWTGGTAHIRTIRWRINSKKITSFDAGSKTITINQEPPYTLKAGWGYFINNKLEALDSPGEWYYDKATGVLYFWTPNGDSPDNYKIEASVTTNGFKLYRTRYVVISGFNIKHQTFAGIDSYKSSDITIKDNAVFNSDQYGIKIGNSMWGYVDEKNNSVVNNVVSGANHYGIFFSSNKSLLSVNKIYNIGLFENMNVSGIGDASSSAMGINMNGEGNTVSKNRVDNIGYIGIHFYHAPNSVIEYNYVTNCCLTVDDGGGIYTYTQNYTHEGSEGSVVRKNIVTDIHGAPQGTDNTDYYAGEGIYIDGLSHDITVEDNTVANCANTGLFMNAGRNNSFIRNTSYNNNAAQIYLREHEYYEDGENIVDVENITINGNIFYSLNSGQLSLKEFSLFNDDTNFGNYDNNYYCNPYSTSIISRQHELYTFEAWQTKSGQDAGSHKSLVGFPEYIVDYYGTELILNSTFDSNIQHWDHWSDTGNAKNSWEENSLLDGGALKHNPAGASNSYVSHNLKVEKGKFYELKFSIVSDKHNPLMVAIIQNHSPYQPVGFIKHISAEANRQDFTFIFEATKTDNNSMLYFYDAKLPFTIDNVYIKEVEVTKTNPKKLSPLFINPTLATIDISLNGVVYNDLDGNKVTGTISLEPFTSRVLTFVTDTATAIVENADNLNVQIYPNPVTGSFTVSTNKNQHYCIYNITGILMKEGKLFSGDNRINISDFKNGMYFIKTEKGYIRKIIKE